MTAILAATLVVTAVVLLVLGGDVPRNPGALLAVVLGIPALVVAVAALAKQRKLELHHR